MNIPQTSLTFKIEENEYTVKFPTNMQLMDLASTKSLFKRQPSLDDGTIPGIYADRTADMISFFSVMCPAVRKDLKAESLSDLDALATKKVMKVYINDILPWLNDFFVLLNSDEDAEKEKENKL